MDKYDYKGEVDQDGKPCGRGVATRIDPYRGNLDQNFVALGTFVLGGAFVTAQTVADDIHPPE